MTSNTQKRMAALGLPDDLPEVALHDAPAPDAMAVERIRRMTMAKAGLVGPAGHAKKAPWTRRPLAWGVAASLALVMFGSIAVAGPSQVWNKLLSYVPGFGATDVASVRLALAGPVRVEAGSGIIEVRGLIVSGESATLRVFTRGFRMDIDSVSLLNALGQELPRTGASVGASTDFSEGWFVFTGNVGAETRSLTVKVGDVDVPVALVPSDQLLSVGQFGPSAFVNGYEVAAQVSAYVDRTAVTLLIGGAPDGVQISGLGRKSVTPARPVTLTAGGRTWYPDRPGGSPGSVWHLEAEPLPAGTATVTLTVPALEIYERGDATVTLKVADGPLDRIVQVGRWPLKLTRTEVVDGNLRIHVDPGPAGSSYLAWILDVKGKQIDHWSWQMDEETGRMLYFEVPIAKGARSVTLTLSRPEVVVEGPWTFEVPVTR